MYDYSEIFIYINTNGDLIGIPCGVNPHVENGIMKLNIFHTLPTKFNDDELEMFLSNVFNDCYSKVGTHDEPTAIQLYTKKKTHVSAVKGLKLVLISKNEDKGYEVMPMIPDKKHNGAFIDIKGLSIKLTMFNKFRPIEKGALALAFKTALGVVDSVS